MRGTMSRTDDIEYALRELNAAFAKGWISETDYEAQDARLRARQAEIRAWRSGKAADSLPVSAGGLQQGRHRPSSPSRVAP